MPAKFRENNSKSETWRTPFTFFMDGTVICSRPALAPVLTARTKEKALDLEEINFRAYGPLPMNKRRLFYSSLMIFGTFLVILVQVDSNR